MSVYTTTILTLVRQLGTGENLKEQIESAASKIFDFDYNIYNCNHISNNFKSYFEKQFLQKYLQYEIGFETVELFKINLESKLNLLLPKYNLLFETFDKLAESNLIGEREKTQRKTGSKSAASSLPEQMLSNGTIGDFTNLGIADNSEISRSDESIEHLRDKGLASVNDINLMSEFYNLFNTFLDEFKILFMSLYY